MLLDMDTELQHLIRISIEKMTSGETSSLTGRGIQNSGKLDLRKALLVAHVLQEVRHAYLEENFGIVLNTYSSSKETGYVNTLKTCCQNITKINQDCSQGVSQIDTSSEFTSSSFFPTSVTNSEVVVSRISQVTRPISVSVNTSHVMCCSSSQSDFKGRSDNLQDDEAPVYYDELDVSSCCEVTSCSSVDDVLLEAESHDHVTEVQKLSEYKEEVVAVSISDEKEDDELTDIANESRQFTVHLSEFNCLPKKKRPLPKEYQCTNKGLPSQKLAKTVTLNEVDTTADFNTYSLTTSTACLTKTTVNSSTIAPFTILESPISFARRKENYRSNPKVIVQLTQSCDNFLPIACTQVFFESRLNSRTARAF